MTIDIEFLLARHPLLLLGKEGCVKGFHRGGVITAVGGGRWNVHPLFAVKRAPHKLCDKQAGGRAQKAAKNVSNFVKNLKKILTNDL